MARGRKRSLKFRLRPDSLRSAAVVFLLLLGLLSALAYFVEGASAIDFLKYSLGRLVGLGFIFLPFLFVIGGLMLMRSRHLRFAEPRLFGGLILCFLAFLISVQFFWQRGGLIGSFIWVAVSQAFSVPGGLLVLAALWVTALIVLLNTSLDNFILYTVKVLGFVGQVLERYFLRNLIAFLKAKRAGRPSQAEGGSEESLEGEAVSEGGEREPIFEIIAPPAEPVTLTPLRSVAKAEEPLKQETVTNVPYAQQVWEYPPLDLLSDQPPTEANRGDVKTNAQVIEKTLESFGVKARVVEVNLGPAVTQYAIESAQGTKIAKITNLQNDLAMALASPTGTIRVEAPIPGKSLIGIEVPNLSLQIVPLKNVLRSEELHRHPSKLAVALGYNVAGQPVVADIARMPHVLIAGSTGSGKSVCLHAFISSLLFRCSPQEVKLILIDPKRVELPQYNDIPHLLTPVIVEADKTGPALKWLISEMTRRYKLFENAKTRNINAYNELSGFQALPYILVFVDELADLMVTAPVEIERAICRLAQMARATGIHLVLATQRPSVDVLTGLIKANIPCRVAFNVTSQVDSRVILDQVGAEKLLGRGDMLYVPPDASKPVRIQGALITDQELGRLIKFLKQSPMPPEYQEEVTNYTGSEGSDLSGVEGERDDMFEEAVSVICSYERASASLLQRRLKIGYARAARLLDQLEAAGVVGPADGSKPREVLVTNPESVTGRSGVPAGAPLEEEPLQEDY